MHHLFFKYHQPDNKSGPKYVNLILFQLCCVMLILSGCGGSTSSATTPTPSSNNQSPTVTASPVPLHVVSLTTTLNPPSFSEIPCGSNASFTFSTVITVTAVNSPGVVMYTWNIGSNHIPGSATFTPGETSKTVSYTLNETNVQPGIAPSIEGSLTVNNDGTTLTSTPAAITGLCTQTGKFMVTTIALSVSPGADTSINCNTYITFVYTATITIAPNSNGGNVVLKWSFSPNPVTLTFPTYQPGASLSQTITNSLSGKILHNDAFPPSVTLSVLTPNAITSNAVKPLGPCIPVK